MTTRSQNKWSGLLFPKVSQNDQCPNLGREQWCLHRLDRIHEGCMLIAQVVTGMSRLDPIGQMTGENIGTIWADIWRRARLLPAQPWSDKPEALLGLESRLRKQMGRCVSRTSCWLVLVGWAARECFTKILAELQCLVAKKSSPSIYFSWIHPIKFFVQCKLVNYYRKLLDKQKRVAQIKGGSLTIHLNSMVGGMCKSLFRLLIRLPKWSEQCILNPFVNLHWTWVVTRYAAILIFEFFQKTLPDRWILSYFFDREHIPEGPITNRRLDYSIK